MDLIYINLSLCSDAVYLLPHFYGELAKTREVIHTRTHHTRTYTHALTLTHAHTQGCDLLEKSKDLHQFIDSAQDENETPLARRAALWALVRSHVTWCGWGMVVRRKRKGWKEQTLEAYLPFLRFLSLALFFIIIHSLTHETLSGHFLTHPLCF